MIMENKPFLLGSNLVTDASDLCDYATFMRTVAGNTGNSYISYALIREICGRYRNVPQVKSLYAYDFSQMERDVDVVNNECSHLCLILQDQIRLHESYGYQLPYQNIIRFLRNVKRPIIVAGLGANSLTGYDSEFHKKLPRNLVRFLQDLSGLVHSIGVRGEFTREVLSEIGIKNVVTIGCPSYYERGSVRKIVKRGYARLGVSTAVSSTLQATADVYLQDCQQHEAEIIKAMAFGHQSSLDAETSKAITQGQLHVFSSIADWQKSLSGMDFFVGVRVHGAICALNSGVPSVVMNRDSRAREMCEYLNIPYLPELAGADKVDEIYAQADYSRMNKEYGERYKTFKGFMHENGLEIVEPQISGCADAQPSLNLVYPPPPEEMCEQIATGLGGGGMTSACLKMLRLSACALLFPWHRKHYLEKIKRQL